MEKNKKQVENCDQKMDVVKTREKKYLCDKCGKSFFYPSHVLRHKKSMHQLESQDFDQNDTSALNEIQCITCGKSFSSARSRQQHMRKFHNKPEYSDEESKKTLKCSECLSSFPSSVLFMEHFSEKHPDITMQIENITFTTFEEFESWKLNMEKVTSTSYLLRKSRKNCQGKRCNFYSCHRSGSFKSFGKGDRHIKIGGSCKIGFYCPARIKTEIISIPEKIVKVVHYSTHVGHQCNIGHLRLTKAEKDEIAGKLHARVPMHHIMNSIAESASPTKRLAATKKQDLRNIEVSYGLHSNAIRNCDDVISVDSWVREMKNGEYNPILMYKSSGEENLNFPSLKKEDFLLGFMNEAQAEIFQIYGNDVISIDSTHGTNKYNIQLTSIIVKDNNWQGFPVAFLWSNRQTEEIFKYFFSSIFERLGMIQSKTFMSDDFPAYYNAWCSVFKCPKFHLICDWHIKRAWAKNISGGTNRICNLEKREKVLNALYAIAKETDEKAFKILLVANRAMLQADEDCKKFAQYFEINYANRPQQWAACYRIEANINTNMTVERWHKELKYNSDLNGKCGGRLDKAIHSLIKSLRMKLMDRLSSLTRGKLTKKLISIRKSHVVAEKALHEINIIASDTNVWLVPSLSNFGEMHTVKYINTESKHSCNLQCEKCNICLHQFRCSCPDSAIKYNLCKHIHIVCMKNVIILESNQQAECEAVNDSLEIVTNNQMECENRKRKAITADLRKHSKNLEKVKEEARAACLGLLTYVETLTEYEQYKSLMASIVSWKHTCSAIASSEKKLPAVITSVATTKKIEPQRQFPPKKKRKIDKIAQNENEALKIILNFSQTQMNK